MHPEALHALHLQLEEMKVERLTRSRGRMTKAEQLQQALWTHREHLVRCALAAPGVRAALRPFARAALIIPDAGSGVLLSIPRNAGRDFVQLRGSDFHMAARAYYHEGQP